MELILFLILAVMAVVAGAGVVLLRNPVHSALALIANMLTLAGFYIMLNAQFLAGIQVFVYTGGVIMLFVFVIMLLQPGREVGPTDRLKAQIPVAVLFGFGLLGLLGLTLLTPSLSGTPGTLTPEQLGSVEELGRFLFTDYLYPFEITSLLLLIGVIGAVILGKRKV